MTPDNLLLWMIFAAILGIVYSLKRIFLLEKKIVNMEFAIGKVLQKIEKEEKHIEAAIVKKKKVKKKKK